MKTVISFLISLIFVLTTFAQDTFSICAVDTATGEVGSAGASCLDDDDITGGVLIISDVHPGLGVVHTQSYWIPANQQYAKELMDEGYSPQEIITLLVMNDAQNNPLIRQYGVVDLSGDTSRSAAYTGSNCFDYKNHILGPNYAIQGNILLGQEILDSMEARFLNAEGSLACRLMEALQGANVVGADTRCAPEGVSSLSAFIRVAKPDDPVDDLYLEFIVPKVYPGVDPIDSLQTLVDQWGGCNFTGFEESKREMAMKVYPNPASQSVTFKFPESPNDQITILLFDAQGSKVHEITGINSQTVKWNTENLPHGIYFYQIIDQGAAVKSGKVIVE